MSVHVVKAALTLRLRVSDDSLDQQPITSAPRSVARALAHESISLAQYENLGYYPPLDYMGRKQRLSPEFMYTLEHLSLLVDSYAREEISRRLSHVFSSVQVTAVQPQAYTMPPVRLSDKDALEHLIDHFDPTVLRLHLEVSLISKHDEVTTMERITRQRTERVLRNVFDMLEICSARVLTQGQAA